MEESPRTASGGPAARRGRGVPIPLTGSWASQWRSETGGVGVGLPSDGLDAAGDLKLLWRHQFRGGEPRAA